MPSSRKILGIWVDCLTMEDAVLRCLRVIRRERRPCLIATLNASTAVMARTDQRVKQALNASELVLADGMPIHWITRALGARAACRVTGVDLMAELLRVAARERLRLYFLGAPPRTKWRRYAETNPVFLVMVLKGIGRRLFRRLLSHLRRPAHPRLEQRWFLPPK